MFKFITKFKEEWWERADENQKQRFWKQICYVVCYGFLIGTFIYYVIFEKIETYSEDWYFWQLVDQWNWALAHGWFYVIMFILYFVIWGYWDWSKNTAWVLAVRMVEYYLLPDTWVYMIAWAWWIFFQLNLLLVFFTIYVIIELILQFRKWRKRKWTK